MDKPREFWIRKEPIGVNQYGAVTYEVPECVNHDDEIHVIEYSAYEQKRQAVEEFVAIRDEMLDQATALTKQLVQLQQENERLENLYQVADEFRMRYKDENAKLQKAGKGLINAIWGDLKFGHNKVVLEESVIEHGKVFGES